MRSTAVLLCLLACFGCNTQSHDSPDAAGTGGRATGTSGGGSGASGGSSGSGSNPRLDASVEPQDAATTAPDDAATAVDAGSVPALCNLPPETGNCQALFTPFYYDPASGTCERFTYGGCDGNANNFDTLAECEDACLVTPRSTACSVEVEDETLPGVRLRVEGERCRVQTGKEHRFVYKLELDQPLAYQAPDSFGSCGRCGGYTEDPLSLVDFSIGADDVWYCLCDVGCCPPTTFRQVELPAGEFVGSIEWPGRAWRGPSDTSEPFGEPFAPGDYDVSVTFDVPNVGSITARLPIEVFGDPGSPAPAGASCEVGGEVFASGEGGIDDPQSCNTCTCDDGNLVCTEIACPEPCPEGTAYGTSCSQCGPADGCEVVRHDCLPSCTTSSECADPELWFCAGGVCKNVCG